MTFHQTLRLLLPLAIIVRGGPLPAQMPNAREHGPSMSVNFAPQSGWTDDNGILLADIPHDSTRKATAPLPGAPCEYSVSIVPQESLGNSWPVLGLQLIDNRGTAWQLALIRSPGTEGYPSRNTFDFKPKAGTPDATPHPILTHFDRQAGWGFGERYRLTLRALADRIEATVRTSDDWVVFQKTIRYTPDEGRRFQPAIRARQMKGSFADPRVRTE